MQYCDITKRTSSVTVFFCNSNVAVSLSVAFITEAINTPEGERLKLSLRIRLVRVFASVFRCWWSETEKFISSELARPICYARGDVIQDSGRVL